MVSILNHYKELVRISLLYKSIERNPDKYYKYCLNVLKMVGVIEIPQVNLTYFKVMDTIFNTIKILEDSFILDNEKLNLIDSYELLNLNEY